MSTTTHPISPEEIMAFLDGELSAERSHAVSTHIENCAECRDLVEELRQTKYNVALWQVATLPASVEKRVQDAVPRVSASSRIQSLGLFRLMSLWSPKPWVRGLAAAAAVMFVLSFYSLPRFKLASPRWMPVDYARVKSDREPQAPGAGPVSIDDRIRLAQQQSAAENDNALHSYGPGSRGGILGKTESDLQMSRIPLQEMEHKPVVGITLAEPMIARTVSLSIISKEFDTARASLDAILARHHGYAANLGANSPQGAARSIQASLRIPAPQLAAAIAELKSLGRVELENQNGEEVTQQHADLVARLKNSRETEQRLQAILTQRTGKISDVLEVEQEIARVRGEIEQMEAEQKNIEHRVDFATIDLRLSEEYKAKLDSPTPSVSTLVHNALINGYHNVSDTVIALILFFAEYSPILLFWAVLLSLPGWLVWRRWRHATAAI